MAACNCTTLLCDALRGFPSVDRRCTSVAQLMDGFFTAPWDSYWKHENNDSNIKLEKLLTNNVQTRPV